MAAISKITIDGFKAFPDSFTLELGGKNLLMYGENGSGKSSIYYALHALLQSQCKDKNSIYFNPTHQESIVNQNTKKPNAKVEILLEGSDIVYSISHAGYKESVAQPTSPLRDLNGQCVFINHKFLFNFFSFRNSQYIDLFPVFIKDILPFVLTQDGSEYISTIYDDVMKGIKRHGRSKMISSSYLGRIKRFNDETKHIVDLISFNAAKTATNIYNERFRNSNDKQLRITLGYDNNRDKIPQPNKSYWLRCGYRYQKEKIASAEYDKKVSGVMEILQPSITLKVEELQDDGTTYRPVDKPQTYFNEAKLTAIALSIRFALLDNITPTNGRFLALDDMLISLDMSNRMKVVKYLIEVVAYKYKIYLFTHDRGFFEYFKHKSKRVSSEWLYRELYMDDKKEPYWRNSETYLGNAEHYINQHEYEIAGNFLRKEAEAFCKEFLPKKLHFTQEYSLLDLNGLICNCKKFAEESNLADTTLFDELDDHRKFVLNPSSHDSYDVVKYENEIKNCFNTLTELRKIQFRKVFDKGQKVEFTLKTPAPNVDVFKFEITIFDDFRLIIQDGHTPIISKGLINYVVLKIGNNGKGLHSANTTLKHFYDVNYQKSDKTISQDFFDSIIDTLTRNPIRTFL